MYLYMMQVTQTLTNKIYKLYKGFKSYVATKSPKWMAALHRRIIRWLATRCTDAFCHAIDLPLSKNKPQLDKRLFHFFPNYNISPN